MNLSELRRAAELIKLGRRCKSRWCDTQAPHDAQWIVCKQTKHRVTDEWRVADEQADIWPLCNHAMQMHVTHRDVVPQIGEWTLEEKFTHQRRWTFEPLPPAD